MVRVYERVKERKEVVMTVEKQKATAVTDFRRATQFWVDMQTAEYEACHSWRFADKKDKDVRYQAYKTAQTKALNAQNKLKCCASALMG